MESSSQEVGSERSNNFYGDAPNQNSLHHDSEGDDVIFLLHLKKKPRCVKQPQHQQPNQPVTVVDLTTDSDEDVSEFPSIPVGSSRESIPSDFITPPLNRSSSSASLPPVPMTSLPNPSNSTASLPPVPMNSPPLNSSYSSAPILVVLMTPHLNPSNSSASVPPIPTTSPQNSSNSTASLPPESINPPLNPSNSSASLLSVLTLSQYTSRFPHIPSPNLQGIQPNGCSLLSGSQFPDTSQQRVPSFYNAPPPPPVSVHGQGQGQGTIQQLDQHDVIRESNLYHNSQPNQRVHPPNIGFAPVPTEAVGPLPTLVRPVTVRLENNVGALQQRGIPQITRGATQQMIERNTTIFKYEKENAPAQICLICQNMLYPGEDIRCLPCIHLFHIKCIDMWFCSDKRCPVCRTDISANFNRE